MIYLYGAAIGTDAGEAFASRKKAIEARYGHSLRRAPKLAVLALDALEILPVSPECALFFGTRNGSMNETLKGLREVWRQGMLPMPFGFINTAPNTVLYYLTLCLGLQGCASLLCAQEEVFDRVLLASVSALASGECKEALAGYAEEVAEPIGLFANALGVKADVLSASAGWLSLGVNPSGAMARLEGPAIGGGDPRLLSGSGAPLVSPTLEEIAKWLKGAKEVPLEWSLPLGGGQNAAFRLLRV